MPDRTASARTAKLGICAVAAGVVLACATAAPAGVVDTRAEAVALLDARLKLEDFEKFKPARRTAYGLDHKTLDSTSVEHRRGPGLVNPGLTFSVTGRDNGMQWSGVDALTNPSAALSFNVMRFAPLKVDFAAPTQTFGVDLLGVHSSNTPPVVAFRLDVFAADDVTLLDTRTVYTDGNLPVFLGYADAAGVGSFTLAREGSGWQIPSLDNLIYATEFVPPAEVVGVPVTAVPLPAAGWAAVVALPGCVACRRVFRR